MKKIYIKPESFEVVLKDKIMFNDGDSEPGITENIGAKENDFIFDEEPFGDLWDEPNESVEDPFSVDY